MILSLKTGLLLFSAATLTLLVGGGSFVLTFTHFLPGLVYGVVLAKNYTEMSIYWRKLMFVVLSSALHVFCAFNVDFLNDNTDATVQLFKYSIIGALVLKFCYDLILKQTFSLLYTIILPIVVGALGSLISIRCMYLSINDQTKFYGLLLWIGIFSIFPLWQCLFGYVIYLEDRMGNKITKRKLDSYK